VSNKNVTAELLADLFNAFNAGDINKVMSFIADDCEFDGAAGPNVYGARFIGAADIKKAFEQVYKTFPDVQWENSQHLVSGDIGVSEWTFTGTREDGKRIEANGVDLFIFADGKIVKKNAFRKDRPLLDPENA
jgi:ketosteroid isomerase-like protein